MENSEIMSLIEQVKNGDGVAMRELGAAYKDIVQSTALSFTTPTKGAQELADALLASMHAFNILVINFQGKDIKEFEAILERDLRTSAERVLTKICEYKTNYTLAGLTALAETDELARVMLATRQEEGSSSQTKSSSAAGFFSKVKAALGGHLLSDGKVMPTELRADPATLGSMVVHFKPIFNNGAKTTL